MISFTPLQRTMRHAGFILLLFALPHAEAAAQSQDVEVQAVRPAPPIDQICRLRFESHTGTQHHPVQSDALRAGSQAMAVFNVTFNGFSPEAEAAFQRAVDTWAALITSSQTIHVEVSFEPLDPGVLGSAGPSGLLLLSMEAGNGDMRSLWFGRPLAEALLDQDTNSDDVGSADIIARFNSAFMDWHFGAGPPPVGPIDFESVVLHELGHGLNFFDLANVDDGQDEIECSGKRGEGCIGFGAGSAPSRFFGVYDFFLQDDQGEPLSGIPPFDNPSELLGDVLTGLTGGVFFGGDIAAANNGRTAPRLFTPNPYESGSSLSHLDNATFDGTPDALMTSRIAFGEMARLPGSVLCGAFEDMFWTVDQLGCAADPATPIEGEMPVVEAFALSGAFPNPFNGRTQFTLTLPSPQRLRVAVYDALGREVLRLHDGVLAPNVRHHFAIDAADLAGGLYFYRAAGERITETQSVVLVK